MNDEKNIVNAPKTSTFQMRINPDFKAKVEAIYARNGITMTDAINVFLQQSINVGGLPFLVSDANKEVLKKQAIEFLTKEINK